MEKRQMVIKPYYTAVTPNRIQKHSLVLRVYVMTYMGLESYTLNLELAIDWEYKTAGSWSGSSFLLTSTLWGVSLAW